MNTQSEQSKQKAQPVNPLRVLIVEDRPADVELCLRVLKQAGLEVSADVVQAPEEFSERVRSNKYDIVLADYKLPNWTGLEALATLQEQGRDIPFVLVTGALGEETAVECIKKGASDYVLKDRLPRLPVAVRHALEEKALREERKRTEAENVRLITAIEQAAEGIVITDTEGTIQYVNPAFTKVTGYTREEALGQNLRLLKSGQHDQSFYQNLWETILAGETWRGDIINRRQDGSLYTEEMSITPVRDERGEISSFIAIKQDITERREVERRLEERTTYLSALIENSPLGIVMIDPDHRVQMVNPAFERLFLYRQAEIITRNLDDFIAPPELWKEALGSTRRVCAGETVHVITRRRRKDGTLVDVELYGVPLRWGRKMIGAYALYQDITERQRAEEERARAVQLQAENEALARANRLKSEFLADMSHELRTPLNSLIGFSEMLVNSMENSLSPEQRRDLTLIHQQAQHLLKVVNDLLDLARIESGAVVLDCGFILVGDLLMRTLDAFIPRLREKKLQHTVMVEPPDLIVYADGRRLEEILSNLVTNAIRFTPQGGIALWSRAQNDCVQFCVEDTGIGIALEDRFQIFDKFYQSHRVAKGMRGGTGLGLAITKQLVELHGGTIWVESTPGQGSQFFFILPNAGPQP